MQVQGHVYCTLLTYYFKKFQNNGEGRPENIFQSSHFYKEARMVSFLDRLMDCITQKIRK